MWVELEGACDENGMLIDYGDMKTLIQPIIDQIDHCFMCDDTDGVLKPFLQASEFKVVFVPFRTTAENITTYLLEKIWKILLPYERITSIIIRLAETETSYAEIHRNR